MDKLFVLSFLATAGALIAVIASPGPTPRRGFIAEDSTSVSPDKRRPIDPSMPNMPPA